MVFHCRCFSFLLQEVLLEEENKEIKHETITQTKPTSTGYTVALDDDRLALSYPENWLDDETQNESISSTFYTAASEFSQSVPISFYGEVSIFANNISNLRVFTSTELQEATMTGNDRSRFVYKGVVKSLNHPFDPIDVVVKHAKGLYRVHEWKTKIGVLGTVKHPNLVKLIGYCVEDKVYEFGIELLLVYEYMYNRSVRDHLHKESETPLSWNTRLKIAQDAARGMTYLHEEMDFQVILRDFKASNILLDDQWNAKLADSGFAMLQPQELRASTSFVGTKAYAAPECITLQVCTSKSDVWSYGVFLYELITGRRPMDGTRPQNEQKLLKWVKPYLEPTRFKEIVDPRLEGDYQLESAQMLSNIANKCLFEDPESRPKMSEVLGMINRLIDVAPQPTGPDIKTSNEDKKDSICNPTRLPSCFSCFNKKGNV